MILAELMVNIPIMFWEVDSLYLVQCFIIPDIEVVDKSGWELREHEVWQIFVMIEREIWSESGLWLAHGARMSN